MEKLYQSFSAVALLDNLLENAISRDASDIHIDPGATDVLLRLRIDGLLQIIGRISKIVHLEVIARIKVLSNLRSDEHAVPQDGKFRYKQSDSYFDIRVSIAPTHHGENAVLRVLQTEREGSTIENLGFNFRDQEIFKKSLARSSGMILSTGPTGSGKTTTLYAMLKHIHTPEKSIITIEDPVEYALPGVSHMQINHRTGFTFASGLRAILRQDPNVIMVGEIRDRDTSQVAIHAALTGHLILSTLHTNDAVTAVLRLLDMGVDAYLIASTVTLSIGQRLVRRICEDCKYERKPVDFEKELFKLLGRSPPEAVFLGRGCEICAGTGYKGRLVIAEIFEMNKQIREAIISRKSHSAILVLAKKAGMRSMIDDAYEKVKSGQTTITEIMRVIHEI